MKIRKYLFFPEFGNQFLPDILEIFGMLSQKDNAMSGYVKRDISPRMREVAVLLNSALARLGLEPCLSSMV